MNHDSPGKDIHCPSRSSKCQCSLKIRGHIEDLLLLHSYQPSTTPHPSTSTLALALNRSSHSFKSNNLLHNRTPTQSPKTAIMRVSIVISLIGSLATASLSTGGITLDPEQILGTCRNIHGDGSDEWVMWACCKNSDGKWKRTRLDLAQCLKNNNGILDPEWGGDAGSSCKDCRFHGSSLGCSCNIESEDSRITWIHLVGLFSYPFSSSRAAILSSYLALVLRACTPVASLFPRLDDSSRVAFILVNGRY